MSKPEKNKVTIGNHGFPQLLSPDRILDIIRPFGDELLSVQSQVQKGFKSFLGCPANLLVNPRPHSMSHYIQQEDAITMAICNSLKKECSDGVYFHTDTDPNVDDQGTFWAIDPVLKFNSYLNGHKDWAIGVGYVQDRKPSGGVVYYPALKQAFFTAADAESYRRDVSKENSIAVFNLSSIEEGENVLLMSEFAEHAKWPNTIGAYAVKAILARIKPFGFQPR